MMFANIHFLEHTFLKIAYKLCGFYARNIEFLTKVEILKEIELQANEDGGENGE